MSETPDAPWGRLFVTRRCCGAATCRNLAPELLAEVGGPAPVLADGHEAGAFTGVLRHPADAAEFRAARAAAAACAFGALRVSAPTASLGPEDRGSPWKDYPREIEPGVWFLGQPSPRNYGALAYFVETAEGGVLIDLPRPSEALLAWLEARGLRWIVLTHVDHAQHHAEYAARFPKARRVLGAADVNKWANAWVDATTDVEVKLPSDQGPLGLDGAPLAPAAMRSAEIAMIPQPGHTPGGFCILVRGRYLFTGDHLSFNRARGHLVGHRLVCWQDWERLTTSIGELESWARAGHLAFAWVLPGHGEWIRLSEEPSPEVTAAALGRCLGWMREQPPGRVSLARWVPFVTARTQPHGWFARIVRALGGARREAWLLPAAVRHYLPDEGGRALPARDPEPRPATAR